MLFCILCRKIDYLTKPQIYNVKIMILHLDKQNGSFFYADNYI